jgi:hypothetical protein
MSTVALPVRAVKCALPAPIAPPVRRGTCNLRLHINGDVYRLRRYPAGPFSRVWQLTKRSGARAGAVYLTGRVLCENSCSCDDMYLRKPMGGCKHIKALVALGLISGRPRRSRSRVAVSLPEGGAR